MFLFRRSVIAVLILCLGCAAQSGAPNVNQRIERQVRSSFSIPPDVQIGIGPRQPSPDFTGYDQITVTFSQGERKQVHDFLVSKDNKTLVRMSKFDLTKDPYAETMSKIDLTGRPVRGNKNAKVTIVNFDDFECPFCSRMHATLMQDVLKTYGDSVRIIYKDFPLAEIHPWAIHAANDANCLASQNADAYWEFADYVHAHQQEISADMKPPLTAQFAALDKIALESAQRHNLQLTPLQSCIKAQQDTIVQASLKEGLALGLSATPMIFVNGEKVDGAVPGPAMHVIVERALRDAGQPVPLRAAAAEPAPKQPEPAAAKK